MRLRLFVVIACAALWSVGPVRAQPVAPVRAAAVGPVRTDAGLPDARRAPVGRSVALGVAGYVGGVLAGYAAGNAITGDAAGEYGFSDGGLIGAAVGGGVGGALGVHLGSRDRGSLVWTTLASGAVQALYLVAVTREPLDGTRPRLLLALPVLSIGTAVVVDRITR